MKIYSIKILFLFSCFFPALFSSGQRSKLDSLLKSTTKINSDTSKAKIYFEIANFYENVNLDSSLIFSQKALEISRKQNWKWGEGMALTRVGWFYYVKGNFKKAIEYDSMALAVANKMGEQGEKQLLGGIYGNLGLAYDNEGEYGTALNFHLKALGIDEKYGNKLLMANHHNNIGNIYSSQSNYPRALSHLFQALKLYTETENKIGIARSELNLGTVYHALKQWGQALEHFEKAMAANQKLQRKRGVAMALCNISSVYKEQADEMTEKQDPDRVSRAELLDKAFSNLQSARKIFEESKNGRAMNMIFMNMGVISDQRSKMFRGRDEKLRMAYSDTSLKYYNRALVSINENSDPYVEASVYGNMGAEMSEKGEFALAEKYLKKALAICEELHLMDYKSEFELNFSQLKEKQGDFKSAMEHFKLHVQAKDSINNEENTKKQTQLEMQFEFDKKQTADSVRVAEEKKLAAAELRTEKNKSYTLYGGLALLLIFAGFIYNRFRVTRSQKSIIEKQKLLVESQKTVVELKQQEIMDSINYAKRIQMAQLPSEAKMAKALRGARK